jgi:hypothetical protein
MLDQGTARAGPNGKGIFKSTDEHERPMEGPSAEPENRDIDVDGKRLIGFG